MRMNYLKNGVLTGLILLGLNAANVFATLPKGFSYQGIVRDIAGDVQPNKTLLARMSIREGSATGLVVWQEQHTKTTNEFGLLNVIVGTGINTGGGTLNNFDEVNWASDIYFLEVEIDFGSGMKSVGTTQLLTVPYSMVADTVLRSGIQYLKLVDLKDVDASSVTNGNVLVWSGTKWVKGDSIKTDYIQVSQSINTPLLVSDSISAVSINADNIQSNIGNIALFSAQDGYINNLGGNVAIFDTINSYQITSNIGQIENLSGDNLTFNSGNISSITSNSLSTNSFSTNLFSADSISTNHISSVSIASNSLTSTSGSINHLNTMAITTDSLNVNLLTADSIDANYANIHYIVTDTVSTNLLLSNAIISSTAEIDLAHITTGNIDYLNVTNLNALNMNEKDGDTTNEVITSIILDVNNHLQIYEGDDHSSVDLSSLADADGDSTNEAIDTLILSGTTLTINEGTNTQTVNLSSLAIDNSVSNELIDSVYMIGNTLFVAENGNLKSVDITTLLGDLDSTNELITDVQLHGDTLIISEGVHVKQLILQGLSGNDSIHPSYADINDADINHLDVNLATFDSTTTNYGVVNSLHTTAIYTDYMQSAQVEIISALINQIDVDSIDNTYFRGQQVHAHMGTFDSLNINQLMVDSVSTMYVQSTYASIDTLVNHQITTSNVVADAVNAVNLNIYDNTTLGDDANSDFVNVNANAVFSGNVVNFGQMDNFGSVINYANVTNNGILEQNDSLNMHAPLKTNSNIIVSDTMLTIDGSNGNLVTLGTLTVGTGGSAVTKIIKTTVAVDISNVTPGLMTTVNIPVVGANLGSVVSVSTQEDLGYLIISSSRVSSVDLVTVKIFNPSGSAINPAEMEFYITVVE